MPVRIWRIWSRTFSHAVTTPTINPATMVTSSDSHGFTPHTTMRDAESAPPNGKLPSTVRSAMFKTRNVKKVPKATRPKMKPTSSVPSSSNIDIEELARLWCDEGPRHHGSVDDAG